MTESFTEYSRQGYFGRIGSSIIGVFVGLAFLLGGVVLLFWNEGRAVHTAKMLKEAGRVVMTVDASRVDPANDGKLVHFTADAKGEPLTDPLFHTAQTAVRLKRTAEMFQWKETEESHSHTDAVGGGSTTTKTYTYSKVWSERPINSSSFHLRSGHDNPESKRVESDAWAPSPVQAGAFVIPSELVSKIDDFATVPLTENDRSQLPDAMRSDAAVQDGKCFVSGDPGRPADPSSPRVGDVRVTLAAAPPGPVSVIGRQTGDTLAGYVTPSGGTIELLYVGAHPAREMIASEQHKNAQLTWILRAVGFVVLWIAIGLMLQPLKVMSSLIGIVGDLVGMGLGLVSFLAAWTIACTVVAIAWVVYRPLLGIALLAVAVAAVTCLIVLRQRHAARRAALAPAPSATPIPMR